MVARLNGYVNFIDGSLVEWDSGWVVVWLDDGGWWLDDGDYVNCVGSMRGMRVGKNVYFIWINVYNWRTDMGVL